MTDNDDLIKKIGDVVDNKLAARLEPIERRLGGLEKGQQELVERVGGLEKGQKKQGKTLKQIKNTQDVLVDHFDVRGVRLDKRVSRIEGHLGLPTVE